MRHNLYYITNETAVLGRYQVRLTATVEGQTCYVAPGATSLDTGHIVYAVGNGDPVYLLTLDDEGTELHRVEEDWAEDFADEIDAARAAACDALMLGERMTQPLQPSIIAV